MSPTARKIEFGSAPRIATFTPPTFELAGDTRSLFRDHPIFTASCIAICAPPSVQAALGVDIDARTAQQKMREIELQALNIARIARINLLAMENKFSKASIVNSIDSIIAAHCQIQSDCITLHVLAKLDSFHPFPRLPSEIRLKIWRLTMPGPRVVHVTYKQDSIGHWKDPPPQDGIWGYGRSQPSPLILQISHESRSEGLKKYSLRLDTATRECYVRIEPIQDTLLILDTAKGGHSGYDSYRRTVRNLLFNGILKPEALKSIKNLAIDIQALRPLESEIMGITNTNPPMALTERLRFEEFTALETLDLVGYCGRLQPGSTAIELQVGELMEYNRAASDFVRASIRYWRSTHPNYVPPKVRYVNIRIPTTKS